MNKTLIRGFQTIICCAVVLFSPIQYIAVHAAPPGPNSPSGSTRATDDPTVGSKAAPAPDAAAKQGSDTKLINPLGANADILTIINRVISSFLGMVGAIALLVFVYGGVMYMTAGGNEKRASGARETLVHAAIGLTIIMFAYTITNTFLYVIAG